MNLLDILAETFRSLTANKGRTALTILGIVVGIGSVIALVSVGQGTSASVQQQITAAGANIITITNTASTGNGLTDGDVDALRELPGVATVAGTRSAAEEIVANNTSTNAMLQGIDANYIKATNHEVSQGRFITSYQNSIQARVVVLSSRTVENLWGDANYNPVDQTVQINGQNFVVTGILSSSGGGITAAMSGNASYIPLSTMTAEFTGRSSYSITLATQTTQDQTAVTNLATTLLKSRHGIKASDDPDFSITSTSSLESLTSSITGILTTLLAAIASISLVVGGIGIMNMMLTSVTERTREIGLRKAIGATPGNITLQFLVEAIVLTSLGGVIGVLLGWLISVIVNATGTLTTKVTATAVLLGVGVCMLIGIVFGFYPAHRAAKLDPIDALRYQ
ncbi:MAG: ABC transporter permease [Actinomycetia bacterium]|nr:ABC transporter permease [Actinomycetes bacterium]